MDDAIDLEDLLTTGQIAARLGQPLHKVQYAIRSRRLRPAGRIGIFTLWDQDDLARIQAVLAEIDITTFKRRPGPH